MFVHIFTLDAFVNDNLETQVEIDSFLSYNKDIIDRVIEEEKQYKQTLEVFHGIGFDYQTETGFFAGDFNKDLEIICRENIENYDYYQNLHRVLNSVLLRARANMLQIHCVKFESELTREEVSNLIKMKQQEGKLKEFMDNSKFSLKNIIEGKI